MAGASSGLGLASAAALAAEGVHVAICGRDDARLALAVDAVRARADAAGASGDVVAVTVDVGTPDGATSFVEQAIAALGGVDILVPNAGGPPSGTFASTPVDAYPAALDLNLMSVVAMCKAAVPAMQAAGWGRVVAITSVSVRQPIPHLILSNTARAGATAFLKTLALEVAGDGVTVNSVQPGFHETDRLRSLNPDLSVVASQVPTQTLGQADDFGAVVAFLASDLARYVTGVHLPVDGGTTRATL